MATPDPSDVEMRKAALVRGAVYAVSAMAGGTLLLLAAGRFGWLATPAVARPASTVIILATLVALLVGVRTLWRGAFARRFDGVGLVALALTLSTTLSFALFSVILVLTWLGGSWLE